MDSGVVSGGDRLESELRRIARRFEKKRTLRVGFLENATYPDGTPVALVAAVQEYGAPSKNIPPRPFFRNMVAANSKDWPKFIAEWLRAGEDVDLVLQLMGELIRGQLQGSINTFEGTPLAPATVAAKGFDKALIDTGHLLNSVDYDIKE